MNIDKHNYEAFFLDYHEGNLTPQQVADLLLFVEQHPELKEEFESFENVTLENVAAFSFENKEQLKKEITVQNKDEYFIGSVEGSLNKTELGLLNDFLKQHPQYIAELDLFQKTKLTAETTIVFENKEELKEIALSTDHLLIASVEGLLTNQETILLNHQLSVDAEMKQNYELYQQTKLKADTSIVFEDKEELKRKERKVIPFYYYVAAAAAVLLLFGLFSLFNNNKIEKNYANKKETRNKSQEARPANESPVVIPSTNEVAVNTTTSINKNHVKIKSTTNNSNIVKEQIKETLLPVANNSVKENPVAVKKDSAFKALELNPVISTNSNAVASAEKKNNSKKEDFLSLGQIAAEKIKEKTLTPEALAYQKKAGRLKKFNGWDLLGVVAKGVSALTGKKVEVEHTSADDGAVTAMR